MDGGDKRNYRGLLPETSLMGPVMRSRHGSRNRSTKNYFLKQRQEAMLRHELYSGNVTSYSQ